jgi:hypothetical protein
MCIEGEPYPPEAIYRGVTMGPGLLDGLEQFNSRTLLDFQDPAAPLGDFFTDKGAAAFPAFQDPFKFHQAKVANGSDAIAERLFVEDSRAPPQAPPANSPLGLGTTTLRVADARPHELANHLLEFFAQEGASVRKVNHDKFTMKVDFFIRHAVITIKVRIYRMERGGVLAAEFCRYSGDCVAFCDVYKLASEHLKPHVAVLDSAKATPPAMMSGAPPALLPEHEEEEARVAALEPLLDLLSSSGPVRADAAAVLADVVKDSRGADCLCTNRAIDEFRKLLDDDLTISVAYPMSSMLSSLVERPEVARLFAQQGLMQLVNKQVRATVTGTLVHQQFSQVSEKVLGAVDEGALGRVGICAH